MVNYPKDWERKKLGDCIDRYINGTSLEEFFTKNGSKRVISLGNYSEDGKYIDDGNRIFINSKTSKYLVDKDDLCMVLNDKGNGRLVGKTILIEKSNEYIINQRSLRLVINKDQILPIFLHQLINAEGFRVKLTKYIQGNTQVYINPPAIMGIEIDIPKNKDEQKSISKVLLSFDTHINNLSRLIEKKKMIRDGALEDLMSGTRRLEGFSGDWEEKAISKITKDVITGGTPSTSIIDYWGGDIPWLASTEIHQKIIRKPTKMITELGLTYSSAKIVPKDSVVIALAGQGKTRGTAAILNSSMAINQSLAGLVCNEETNSKFIYYVMNNNYNKLRELSSGNGGRGGLNKKLLKEFIVYIPTDIKEQETIADILSAMDKEIENLEREKEKYIQLKAGAMDDLLTGKVRLV